MRTFLLLCILCVSQVTLAQDDPIPEDTVKVHSPKKAAWMSAIVPGSGQIYNKKYWKLPIVYVGMGAAIYFIIDNNNQYNLYRDDYLSLINGGTGETGFTESQLLTLQDTYRRWRDLSWIACGAVYALQIVDAAVDAHFFDWEEKINDDLTIRISPHTNLSHRAVGLKIALKL